jgi:hypothetical protein
MQQMSMNLIEVNKDQFYAAIGGPENIHPQVFRTHSVWQNQHTRAVVGRTTPGYMHSFGVKSRYFLESGFAEKKGVHPNHCGENNKKAISNE